MSDLPAAARAAAGLLAMSVIPDAPQIVEETEAHGSAIAGGDDNIVEPRARASRANKRSSLSRMCKECGTTDTPSWRRGADGARTLCNACGLKFLREFRKEVRRKGDPEPAHVLLRPLAHPIPPKKRKSVQKPDSAIAGGNAAHDALQSSLGLEADIASLPDVQQRLPSIADRPPDLAPVLSSQSAVRDEFSSSVVAQSSSSTSTAKKIRPSVDFDFILNAGDDDFSNVGNAAAVTDHQSSPV